MYTGRPQISISRVFDAPRSLVYRAGPLRVLVGSDRQRAAAQRD